MWSLCMASGAALLPPGGVKVYKTCSQGTSPGIWITRTVGHPPGFLKMCLKPAYCPWSTLRLLQGGRSGHFAFLLTYGGKPAQFQRCALQHFAGQLLTCHHVLSCSHTASWRTVQVFPAVGSPGVTWSKFGNADATYKASSPFSSIPCYSYAAQYDLHLKEGSLPCKCSCMFWHAKSCLYHC